MIYFYPYTSESSEQLVKSLFDALKTHPVRRAYLGRMAILNEKFTSPCLCIEWAGPFPHALANTLSEIAKPYAKEQIFNVVPVPPGPHWNQISTTGLKVVERLH